MRKPLLAALIAATALVPVAASAQDERRGGLDRQAMREQFRAAREARQEAQPQVRQDRPDRAQFQQQREQFRAQREQQQGGGGFDRSQFQQQREAMRAQREAFRAQQQVQQPAPVQPGVTGNLIGRRGDWQQFRGERRDDRQQFRAERRDDRQDFARERRDDRQDFRRGQVTRDQFLADRRDDRRDFRDDRRDDRRDFRNDRRDDRRDFRQDQRRDWNRGGGNWGGGWSNNGTRGNDWNRGGWNDRGAWNRTWRNDRRYDWQGWRGSNRGAFRLPRYFPPQGYGYGYQRFGIGVTLGAILFGQNYWIDDPWSYRLPDAYGPYRWVRYYNDALLVDLETGEVVDAVYDIFW